MKGPYGATEYARGSKRINDLLDQGWTIVPNDFRNHLLPSRLQDPKVETVSTPCDNDTAKAEPAKVEQTERKGRRPRMNNSQRH